MKHLQIKNLFAATILAASPLPSYCGEDGGSNYLPGFYGDFAMAVMPGPGTYFNSFFAVYGDANGQTGNALEMPGIIHVTDQHILGADFLLGFFPGFMATWDHSGASDLNRFGLADSYIVPAALNWHLDNVSVLAFEGIVAPTGRYEKDGFNSGRNIWSFDHVLAITWSLPADNELSMTVGYMNNLKNTATDYQSGDELHVDYMLGHYLSQNFALGITGSYYYQVTADQAPAHTDLAISGEAATLGPVVMFTPHIGDRDLNMSLKWLHEFAVEGREAQEYLLWRLFMAF